MIQSIPRRLFNLVFWAAVAAIGYAFHKPFIAEIDPKVREVFQAFTTVVYIVAGLAALFALHYLNEAIASTFVATRAFLTGDRHVNYEKGDMTSKIARTAHRLEKKGNFAGAAEAFESLEMWDAAAGAYEKDGQLTRAAQALEKAGEGGRAIELYEREGNYEAAAARSSAEGLRDRAMKNYRLAAEKAEENNRFTVAAEFYEKGNEFSRAARVYESLKRIEDAMRCYERAGLAGKVEEMVGRVDAFSLVQRGEAGLDLVRRAAELMTRNGNPAKAGELLETAQDFVRAAECYEHAKEWERAGDSYLKADRPDRAETSYGKIENPLLKAECLARVAMNRGDWQVAGERFLEAEKLNQAVDAFKRSKDFVSAAKVYEQLKRFLLAAEMYSLAKEVKQAAEAYAKAHDWRNAAECFESAGEHGQAVTAYAAAGDFARAGRLAVKVGDHPKAIEYLQRVAPTSPDWKMATGFLACAFLAQRRVDMARELFGKVIDQIAPALESLPILYGYARLLENERPQESLALYRRILGVSVDYEDVADRIRLVETLPAPGAAAIGGVMVPPTTAPHTDPGLPGFPPASQQSPMPRRPVTGWDMQGPAQPTVQAGASTETRYSPGMQRPPTQAPETRFGEEGRYRIIQELGRGGMAIVYKAFDQHLEREVALKTFPLGNPSNRGNEEHFLREARLIARLSHPNIVTIFDSGHLDYLYYIAMEYVQGENLKALVKRKGPLSLEEVRQIFRQLADALDYAHSQQVLHRDIKPGNVILRQAGDIKVVDFGLAKILSDAAPKPLDTDDDSQRTLLGTPQYMAPEQILGNAVDPRTDIYAMGLTLFFVLTGRTPFDVRKVTDPLEISRMQVHSSFPRPSTLRATLPRKVDEVFVRCTQKNPGDRYSSAREFLEDFARL